jgi:hypothetical protein
MIHPQLIKIARNAPNEEDSGQLCGNHENLETAIFAGWRFEYIRENALNIIRDPKTATNSHDQSSQNA